MDQLKKENKKLKEKLLDFSVSPENFYLIQIRQEWNTSSNTQCSLQYNGCMINVKASSSYNNYMKNLFNGKNEVYHETRRAVKPEQSNNYVLIYFSVPVCANSIFITASNKYVYEAPKDFDIFAFDDDENKKVSLFSIKGFIWKRYLHFKTQKLIIITKLH